MVSEAESITMPWLPDWTLVQEVTILSHQIAECVIRLNRKEPDRTAMWNFMLGVIVGTVLTAMVAQAAGKDGTGGNIRPLGLNDERERQFQLQLEQMRQQTELEQARMQGKRKPC